MTWEPWITKVSGEKKGHVIFSSKETPNLILDVLAISTKTAKNKPAETRAFLKALNRGYEFVQKHTDEAAALAAKALEQKPDEVKAMLPKVLLYSPKQNLEVMAGPAADGDRAGGEVLQGQEGQRDAGRRQQALRPVVPEVGPARMPPAPLPRDKVHAAQHAPCW